MTWKGGFLLLVIVFLLSACDLDTLSPDEQAADRIVVDGLVTQLTLDRTEVPPGGEFTATYSIGNSRSEPVRLETACTALARGVVYRDGEEARFIGSGSGCWTALNSYEIPAGETLEWTWEVTAATILRAYPDGREPDTEEAEPGEYVFRVEPNVHRVNDVEESLPRLRHVLVVR